MIKNETGLSAGFYLIESQLTPLRLSFPPP